MNLGPITDPQLLDLLREISADPKSRLMKLATQGADTHVGLREPPLSEGEPFLTRAERHLLREHREQVAYLLFKAGQRDLFALEQAESLLLKQSSPNMGVDAPGSKWFQAESSRLQGARPGDQAAIGTLAQNADRLTTGGSENIATALVTAQLRLAPRDSARNHLAICLILEGRRKKGIATFQDALRYGTRSLYESIIGQNLAFEWTLDGDHQRAMELYQLASLASSRRSEPAIGWLHAALSLGDRASVLWAAGHLSELEDAVVDSCVEEHLRIWRARRRHGSFAPDRDQNLFSSRTLEDLPSLSARIAELFL